MSRYTAKQIEKYRRQKYIGWLEKIGKNLFRLLRQEGTTAERFAQRMDEMFNKLTQIEKPRMDSEYLQQAQAYVERLYALTQGEDFDDATYAGMRDAEMSNLNRLQKLKNKNSYKKEKHRHSQQNQDWG